MTTALSCGSSASIRSIAASSSSAGLTCLEATSSAWAVASSQRVSSESEVIVRCYHLATITGDRNARLPRAGESLGSPTR
ncbi:MAG: hypothetical protein QM733_13745 [Ilumatobacteraceae bacterium]